MSRTTKEKIMGTPCIYNTDYCVKAEEILSRGKSLAAVCADLNIARSTLYEWRDNHPEFKQAIDRGLQKSQVYWEEIGEDGIKGKYERFAGTPWVFTMKTRFKEDYKEDKSESKDTANAFVEKLLMKQLDDKE